jgi:lipopolysaccharide export system permease protein
MQFPTFFTFAESSFVYICFMRKIDWYILKKFLVTFFFCLLLFTVVAVAVDSSEKTDDFVKANLSTMDIIKKYYFGFVPWIWSLLFPLFVFIAVIFFTSRMATRSEIIAILASGTSYNRFLRAYFIGGFLLASILWLGNRYWIPRANILRSNFQSRFVDKNDPSKNLKYGTTCFDCYYRRIDSNTFIGIRNFDTTNKIARGFFMERIRDDKVFYNLRAEVMRWDTASGKWKMTNVAERLIDSMSENLRYYDTLLMALNIRPQDFRNDYYMKDKLTTPELIQYIRTEEMRGTEGLNALKVERYRRTATPTAVLLLTMIGVVIASRRTRGGSGIHLALGIVIAALFIVSDRFSTVFATKGNFPPLLAAWLPNIVFFVVAIWLYRKTPK